MKTKEIIQLVIGIIIFAVAGYLIYMQVGPKNANSGSDNQPTVEKVTPVPAEYNQQALQNMNDSSKVRDFYSQPDLSNGVGTSQPFGSLQ